MRAKEGTSGVYFPPPPTGPPQVLSLKGKETMPSYLLQASYTTEALASLIKKPQNRTEIVRKTVEKLGGTLTGLWLSFGDHDVVAIFDMPDNTSAAALALAVGAGGTVKNVKTTPLFTVDDGLAAMKKAATSGYKPVSTS
jgi:uncharacterized protein with GYD domain